MTDGKPVRLHSCNTCAKHWNGKHGCQGTGQAKTIAEKHDCKEWVRRYKK